MTNNNQSKHRTEAYWQELSDEWKQSGLSQPEFCKQKNIPYGQFVTWRSKLLHAAGISRSQLKPVKMKPSVPLPNFAVQIHLPNGLRIQVTNETDEASLGTVLRALGYPAC